MCEQPFDEQAELVRGPLAQSLKAPALDQRVAVNTPMTMLELPTSMARSILVTPS